MNLAPNEQATSPRPDVRTDPIAGLRAANSGPTPFGHMTELYATVDSGTDVSYDWNCGDGHRMQGATIRHTYDHPGEYMATVTASNTINRMTATTFVIVGEWDVWPTQPSEPRVGPKRL